MEASVAPTLVLLPGMDGTGRLFDPFVAAWGGNSPVMVLRYPATTRLDYPSLTAFVRERLPQSGQFVLLGESFSGPLAVSLAAVRPAGLIGVVLCASFARNPLPIFSCCRALIRFLPIHRAPAGLVHFFTLGRFATASLKTILREALAESTPEVLRGRIREILSVDVTEQLARVTEPLLDLRASEDRLVPTSAAHVVRRFYPSAEAVSLPVPHLLLQVAPEEGARIIKDFMDRCEKRANAGL